MRRNVMAAGIKFLFIRLRRFGAVLSLFIKMMTPPDPHGLWGHGSDVTEA